MKGIKRKIRTFARDPEVISQILLAAALLASCFILFWNYLFGDELMVYYGIGNDTLQQYTMHYAGIINHLRNGSFSFWDFTNGFGINLYGLNLFDPTLILLYAVGVVLGPAHMLIYLSWVQVLRILAAGWIFYRYLMKFPFGRQTRFAASYIYGLNGYLLVWGQHYQFGIVTFYFPLMLLFAEKFLRREKGGAFFPVSVFLCASDSVYFSYMSLIGVGFYLLFRVWMMDGWKIKERILRFGAGCVQILLGIAMSAGTFLPMASVLLNVTNRISEEGSGIAGWLKNLFTFYDKEYYNMLQMRLFSSLLENSDYLIGGPGRWNYYEAPVLFCCTLTVFLAIQFLAVYWRSGASRRRKAAVYTAAVLMILCVLMPWGGTMFNSFVEPSHRYTFVLIPFWILAGVWMWDELKSKGRICRIGLILTEAFLLWVIYVGYTHSQLKLYRRNAFVLGLTGTVMALGIAVLAAVKAGKARRAAMILMAAALTVNVLSEGAAGYRNRLTLRKQDTDPEVMEELREEYTALVNQYGEIKITEIMERPQDYFRVMYFPEIQEIEEYLREIDPEFYRMEKDYCTGTWAMDSLAQEYRGISTYNSVMNGNIREFVDTCYPELYYLDKNHYVFWPNAEDHWFAAFTGIRYLVSRESDLDSSKYRLLKQFDNIYLYENVLEADIARFYDTAISEESLKALCSGGTRQELLDHAIAIEDGTDVSDMQEFRNLTGDTDAAEKSSVTLNNPEKDSYITGRVQASSDGYVLFMIPYEKGWSLSVDGEDTELIRGDLGFLACRVEEGDHELELTFQPPLQREGIVTAVVFWAIYGMWLVWEHRRKRTANVRR